MGELKPESFPTKPQVLPFRPPQIVRGTGRTGPVALTPVDRCLQQLVIARAALP